MVDTVAPDVTLSAPSTNTTVTDRTPRFSGSVGTRAGDLPAVTLELYTGTSATGTPTQTLQTTGSNGSWSLTPTSQLANGTYTAQAIQTDRAGNTGASGAVTFTVDAVVPAALRITTSSLPSGSWGGNYSARVVATGGTQPYSWSISSGSLPPGLSLSTSTGVISGTPQTEGSWQFSIKVVDAAVVFQSTTTQLTVNVPSAEITNAPGESPFAYQIQTHLGETGAVMSMSAYGTYAYSPSVLYDSSTGMTKMWFCAGDRQSGGNHGDAIWYSQSSQFGISGSWSTPVEVIRSSNWASPNIVHDDYLDGWQACDPSVAMANNYYYVAYTGATNWTQGAGHKYSSWCSSSLGEGNCDNRIFLARVPVGQAATPDSYSKLVDVGECPSSSCFQFQPFWQNGNQYPPVPIVRNEIGSVWRQAGTGSSGTTTPQTTSYGIGQPSLLNVGGHLVIFFTRVFGSDAAEGVWQRSASDFLNGFALQDYSSYYRRIADRGNDVDYDVAFDAAQNRYVAAIGKTTESPRVMYAETTGSDVTLPSGVNSTLPASNCLGSAPFEIISCNLDTQPQAGLPNTETDAHNVALLRDQYGNLASSPGHSGGPSYDWVYYSDGGGQSSTNWKIVRIPFTRTPAG